MTRIYVCLILGLFVFLDTPNSYGDSVIEGKNARLSRIVCNEQYDLNKRLVIKDDSQEKFLIKNRSLYESVAGPEDYSAICIQAFVKWCNGFVQEKRDYSIFRVPNVTNCDSDYIKDTDGFIDFKAGSSEIIIDPLYDNIPMNKYLQNNNVIVAINTRYNISEVVVSLGAIIPFDGSCYRYNASYVFNKFIDKKRYNKDYRTNNTTEISKIIGKQIESNPVLLIFEDGELSDYFFFERFINKFTGMKDCHIKRVEIHPESNPVTLKSMFCPSASM